MSDVYLYLCVVIDCVPVSVDVFICGGYNGELILDDLWKINLQTFQWTRLPVVMPEPAYFHCAAVTPVSVHTTTHILFHKLTTISLLYYRDRI